MSEGIHPNMLVCRSVSAISDDIKDKLALFCNVKKDSVISLPDAKQSIYEIPLALHQEKVLEQIEDCLNLPLKKADLTPWTKILKNIQDSKDTIDIAFVGKYLQMSDAYKSVFEAFDHASFSQKHKINFINIDPEELEKNNPETLSALSKVQGVFVPGGFGNRGINGKIQALNYGRTHNIPTFGICLGLQCMVIEYARNVLKIEADSVEFNPDTQNPIIEMLSNLKNIKDLGGTMRLGAYTTTLAPNTKVADIYKKDTISERHRHRFEVNPTYTEALQKAGLVISGRGPSDLVECVEIPSHPWYVGVQYHPEFLSSPLNPHPLFESFVKATINNK